ncbi:MAG TPA: serine hydrolase [Candidatus Paceibacterota bacterium]|nr:serine hydrolase [Candidatus Paceibacterota bacterium]HOL53802.1 serine hydrolase [Candidatus Paceibacterota bacterium]HON21566.1 serine hydrolase [Candidatus Paceibacterota bacterium]HPP16943.1 serine hydrolase [Candidatus Paceibacterota bacterium]
MDSWKKIVKIILIIIVGVGIGFGGSWFYAHFFINENFRLNGHSFSDQYTARSNLSAITYPFRNWDVRNDPSINAEGALLVDLDSDFIFYQKQPNLRRPIASLTKLMTAVIAEKNFSPDEEVTISEKALNTDGDPNIFYQDERLKVNDLIKALLMISSNKAAQALALHMGEEKFVGLMNEMAKELEMTQTTFVEPTGLSFLNQSTPSDLKKLLRYIVDEHPNLLIISKTAQDKITGVYNKGQKSIAVVHDLSNINLLSHNPDFLNEINVIYAGGKTGFTDEAWQTFCGVFLVPSQRSNEPPRRVLVVVLKTADRYNDIETLLRWLNKAYVF